MRATLRNVALGTLLVALGGCRGESHPAEAARPSASPSDTAPVPAPSSVSAIASSTPPTPATSPRAAIALPTYPPGPKSAALCEDYLRTAHRHDAALPALGDFGGGGFPVATFDRACFPTPKGAWALEVGEVRPKMVARDGKRVAEELAGSYRVVHLDASGTRSSGPPVPFDVDEWHSFMLDELLFDFDADGEPELLLHTQTTEHTAAGSSSEAVFASTGGAVQRYAPAATIPATMSKDIDSDGRPDLLYTGEEPFRIEGTSDALHTSMIAEVLFAAHSLPDGQFSTRDAAAVAYVKEQCPASPAAVIARAFGAIDEAASVRNVHCARVWGVSPADIKAQITRDCGPAKPQPRGRPATSCANFDMLLTWADFVPPVSLVDGGP